MTQIRINGAIFDVSADYTLLQALEEAGMEVPHFCFHERLSIAGNCRMCLVEVKGGPPKPVASCAMNVSDLRAGPNGEAPEIFTNTLMVKKAREGVMEFLLLNHPLDCPICDQGGECDLQDQAMAFGCDHSRLTESKRAVEDKYWGPLVATVMTRCIHCTRCVRFMAEIAGVPEIGMVGRGEDARIEILPGTVLSSELQGNIIDLCPVGALTSRPHAFRARSWELVRTPTIDVMDAVGSAIHVETKGPEVIRILPRLNEAINEEWISDKTRFVCDGLRVQRLDTPFVRDDNGRLRPASWEEAFESIRKAFKKTRPEKTGAIAGDLCALEEIHALKLLLSSMECINLDCRQDGSCLNPAYGRAGYIFNPGIEGIEEADALLIIGANPRFEAPLLNVRIRKRWSRGNFPVAVIGETGDLLYEYTSLGNDIDVLNDMASGNTPFFSRLANAHAPIIMTGQGALCGRKGQAVLSLAAKIALAAGAVRKDWNGFGILHNAAGRVGALDIGFVPGKSGRSVHEIIRFCNMIFLLGADEIDISGARDAFLVYIGTHGDEVPQHADVILPGATYAEKSGTYVNTEGRVQQTWQAIFPPGEAREDWSVVHALAEALGFPLPFDSLSALRATLYSGYPHLARLDCLEPADPCVLNDIAKLETHPPSGECISSSCQNFYLSNPIARASPTMAACSALGASRKTDENQGEQK